MKLVQLSFLSILLFTTATLSTKNLTAAPDHIQRLSKRGCVFTCCDQNKCDLACGSLDYGTFLLGVCHRGKCFCGFLPGQ